MKIIPGWEQAWSMFASEDDLGTGGLALVGLWMNSDNVNRHRLGLALEI
jgi:hypothetical protein